MVESRSIRGMIGLLLLGPECRVSIWFGMIINAWLLPVELMWSSGSWIEVFGAYFLNKQSKS
jgi:hypothetical protein